MTLHAGQVPPPIAAAPSDPVYRLSVAQYHELIDAGILTSDDPVEMLEGVLVQKMSKKPPHSATTRRARRALERAIPSGFFVDSQEPVTTGDSEPEPDLCIVRGNDSAYETRHPGPEDAPLIVEVSDTTLATDRGTKKRVYARAQFPVYWIINLIDLVVEVYSAPSGPVDSPDYGRRDQYRVGDVVPLVIDGSHVGQVAVADIFAS